MRIMDWSSDVGSSDLVRRRMPGRHNAMNALAAIAAARAVNIPVAQSVAALADFAGLARRYEVLGQAAGVTVIDDFAHNPDKVAATLAAVAALPGRALLFFQPHGSEIGRAPCRERVCQYG